MAARGVPPTTARGWYRDRARTGHPEKAGQVGRTNAVLYASGEESVSQVALRAQRLGIDGPQLEVVAELPRNKTLNKVLKYKLREELADKPFPS